MITLTIIGGSAANGAGGAGAGWSELLKSNIEASPENTMSLNLVYILGILGDTSDRLAQRFQSEVESRLRKRGDNVVILQVGGNDTLQNYHTGLYAVSPEQFERNLFKIRRVAHALSVKLIVQLIPPVNEKATRLPLHNYKTTEATQLFNQRLLKVFHDQKDIVIVDAPTALGENYAAFLCVDGVHPNPAGHRLIFDKMLLALEELGVEIDN